MNYLALGSAILAHGDGLYGMPMMNYDNVQNMTGGNSGFAFVFIWIVYILVIVVLIMAIIALWKYINKK